MHKSQLKNILQTYKNGNATLDETLESLKHFPLDDIGCAKIDTHRHLRQGFPEVVFCEGKTLAQIKKIVGRFTPGTILMATRAGVDVARAIKKLRPDSTYHKDARVVVAGKVAAKTKKKIVVVSAGTADIPVASEAAVTAEVMGNPVEKIFDVGVAGIHRLFAHKKNLSDANVIVVVAGMEGALASIVGGIVSCPVIAVPTSVGYGAHFGGVAPLLTMLNSCAPGVAVVNIDNGFGAGYCASLINQTKD